MSDLPPLISERLANLCEEIEHMRRGGRGVRRKPHKFLMLLAVLDLADDGLLQHNRIDFASPLISRFEQNFRQYAGLDDWFQPGPPYFHLRNSSFWHHQVRSGREGHYARLSTSGGGSKWILDNIEYAYLSQEAYSVVSHPEARQNLRLFIIDNLSGSS